MALEEKSAWVMGVVAIVGYGVYLSFIFAAAEGSSIHTVNYIPALILTIGAAIIINIVVTIAVGIASPRKGAQKDSRDREIYRFGEYAGQSFVIAGALGALILAMLEVDHFWIANEIYLAFVLSAVLASVMKIVGYRVGFQKW